jgi:hypothetical protein
MATTAPRCHYSPQPHKALTGSNMPFHRLPGVEYIYGCGVISMKKIHVPLFILTLITADLFSQEEIIGKWYAINRSGLIEVEFTNDSLIMRTLYSDLSTKGFEKDKKRHSGIFKLKDKFLIVFPEKNKENKFRAMTLSNFKNGESIEIAANGVKEVTGTIDELVKLSSADTTTLYGNIIYSHNFISVMKKMKDIEQMTLQDFKSFLTIFIRRKNTYEGLADNMAGTQGYQLIIRILF